MPDLYGLFAHRKQLAFKPLERTSYCGRKRKIIGQRRCFGYETCRRPGEPTIGIESPDATFWQRTGMENAPAALAAGFRRASRLWPVPGGQLEPRAIRTLHRLHGS